MKNNPFRTGIGYDIHRLKKGRKFILGGVSIKHSFGLDGHSDADVLIHSIMDSMLGAAGLSDIGCCFPNSDKKFKDISSLKLLAEVYRQVCKKGFKVVNVDSSVIAEAPKIATYADEMKKNIADILKINRDCVGIKATTNEGVGSLGAKKAVASYSVCLLVKKS